MKGLHRGVNPIHQERMSGRAGDFCPCCQVNLAGTRTSQVGSGHAFLFCSSERGVGWFVFFFVTVTSVIFGAPEGKRHT